MNGMYTFVLAFTSLFVVSAQAQDLQTTKLQGLVLDAGSMTPIGSAIVKIVDAAKNEVKTATDQDGHYLFEYLPLGTTVVINISKGEYIPKDGRSIKTKLTRAEVTADTVLLIRNTKDLVYFQRSVEALITTGVEPNLIWRDIDSPLVDAEVKAVAAHTIAKRVPATYKGTLGAYASSSQKTIATFAAQMNEALGNPTGVSSDTLTQIDLPKVVIQDVFLSTWVESCADISMEENCTGPSPGYLRLGREVGLEIEQSQFEKLQREVWQSD